MKSFNQRAVHTIPSAGECNRVYAAVYKMHRKITSALQEPGVSMGKRPLCKSCFLRHVFTFEVMQTSWTLWNCCSSWILKEFMGKNGFFGLQFPGELVFLCTCDQSCRCLFLVHAATSTAGKHLGHHQSKINCF